MCGLFGAIGPGINQNDLDALRDLGIVSMLRGEDGAGIYQASVRNYFRAGGIANDLLVKTSWPFLDLMNIMVNKKNKTDALLDSVVVNVIMGHVRAATIGAITDENAHPFETEHYVGCHNGTLRDLKYAPVKNGPDVCDSKLLFDDIELNGLFPVIKALNKDSAYAITLLDKRKGSVFFLRNEKRPLSFARLKRRNVIFWASEKMALKYVLARNNIEADYYSMKPNCAIEINPCSIDSIISYPNLNGEENESEKQESPKEGKDEKAARVTEFNAARERGKAAAAARAAARRVDNNVVEIRSQSVPPIRQQLPVSTRRTTFTKPCDGCGKNVPLMQQHSFIKNNPSETKLMLCFKCEEQNKNLKEIEHAA